MTPGATAFEAILDCVEAFRAIDRDIQLGSIIAFLHVCEHEGVPIKNLVHLYGYSESSMSRYVHVLASSHGAVKKKLGLVEIVSHPDDRRRRLVFLTGTGKHLKDKLHGVMAHKNRERA
jgi:DNA-binding MarR family transcriptional regulator